MSENIKHGKEEAENYKVVNAALPMMPPDRRWRCEMSSVSHRNLANCWLRCLSLNNIYVSLRGTTCLACRHNLCKCEWIIHRGQNMQWYPVTNSMVSVFLDKLGVTQIVKKIPVFMEPEGSSSYSQKPATGPYPEPAESSLTHRSLSP